MNGMRHQEQSGSQSDSAMAGFYANPAVTDRVLELANPGEIFAKPAIRCRCCKGHIGEKMFRGKVARPKPELIAVSGSGFCIKCRVLTPATMLVHRGGSLDLRVGGQWVRQKQLVKPVTKAKIDAFGTRLTDQVTPVVGVTKAAGHGVRLRLEHFFQELMDFGRSPVYRAVRARF